MPRKSRKGKRGGSGIGFRIPSSVVRTLHNRNKKNKPNKPALPTRPESHPNLTNADLENLHVVNTNTNEWKMGPGNRNRYVPKNLRWQPQAQAVEAGPGVRIFKTR